MICIIFLLNILRAPSQLGLHRGRSAPTPIVQVHSSGRKLCRAWSVEEEKILHPSQLCRERRSSRNSHRTLSADEEKTLHLTQSYCMHFMLELASNMERRRSKYRCTHPDCTKCTIQSGVIVDRKAQKKRIQLSTPNDEVCADHGEM